MKTVNSSIEIFLSLAGILALTFLTVSIYRILSPQVVESNQANVAGLTTKSMMLTPDVDLLISKNQNLTFRTEKKNSEYSVSLSNLEKSASSPMFRFRNPNQDQEVIKISVQLPEADVQNFEIIFKYKNQTLTLNSLTGFTKSVTLPANTTIDLELEVRNLLENFVEKANFKINLTY